MTPASEGHAEVLPTHSPALFEIAVQRAIAVLRDGGVVGLPTETVYGLAADARNPAAVRRIYEIKDRPTHNPLIVHVGGEPMARTCAREWPPVAVTLARAFWPGPLTLVLPRSPSIPDEVTAGGDTVGLRWPAHPLMQRILRDGGLPLAAPSANRANQLSPTTADHVLRSLGDRLSLVIDGGACHVGIESTVLDLTVHPPRILRPGMIDGFSLAAVVGELAGGQAIEGTPRSPGQFPRHYAPRARLLPVSWRDEGELLALLRARGIDPAEVHVLAYDHIPSTAHFHRVCVLPHDPPAYARALYAEWHRCDELGAHWIVVEAVPASAAWQGIADRLGRAAFNLPG